MTAARIKEQVNRQHADIQRLIVEVSSRSHNLSDNKTATVYTLANLTPTKNGMPRTRKDSQSEPARTSDKQISALKQHVQILELRMAASEYVC